MSPLDYSLSRLNSVIEEIGRLKESEFPCLHTREALERLEELFLQHHSSLSSLPLGKNRSIVDPLCSATLTDLFKYVPLLGFILRSTNVRNAFELYGPLLRLSQHVLGPDTKLIISSEWEQYSPFTFREIAPLPNFVLIGIPAPESSNPLLIPLAGHELGHTIWRVRLLASKYVQRIEEAIFARIESRLNEYNTLFPLHYVQKNQVQSNIFVKQNIAMPVQWALKQCEEHFCDFVGLYLFDESYFHAFAYLLAPHMAGQRSVLYPNTLTRVGKLIEAAGRYRAKSNSAYTVPQDYSDLFQDMAEVPAKEQHKKFLVSLADAGAASLTTALMDEADRLLSSSHVPQLSSAEKERILKHFKFVVPAPNALSLCNILNAAWAVYHDRGFWKHITRLTDPHRVLKELVLKNVEVLEIEQILQK